MRLRKKLIVLNIMKRGDWYSMYQVLKSDPYLNFISDELLESYINKLKLENVLTILDKEYPEILKDAAMPPFVLFYQGNLSLLNGKKIGVIGGKKTSDYGAHACIKIITQLIHKNCVILSGLQPGIEMIAHKRTLKIGKKITILSWGFEKGMSKSLGENHLVLTEYPFGVQASWRQYYRSYGLVQQLSDNILILEMPKEDRRLHTLKQTIYAAKPVFILPDHYDSIYSKGGLSLINEGASCFLTSEDILKNGEIMT